MPHCLRLHSFTIHSSICNILQFQTRWSAWLKKTHTHKKNKLLQTDYLDAANNLNYCCVGSDYSMMPFGSFPKVKSQLIFRERQRSEIVTVNITVDIKIYWGSHKMVSLWSKRWPYHIQIYNAIQSKHKQMLQSCNLNRWGWGNHLLRTKFTCTRLKVRVSDSVLFCSY